jgi:hypothetical protein
MPNFDKLMEEKHEPTKEPIAILGYMDGYKNKFFLAIKTDHPDKYIWLYSGYSTSDITIQESSFRDISEGNIIRKFYEGDEITFTL